MNRFSIFIITVIMSMTCMAQTNNDSITIKLQQVEFIDQSLPALITKLTGDSPKCFDKDRYYTLIFFQPTLRNDYVITIDKLYCDEESIQSLTYYAVVNNIVLFFSDVIPEERIKVLPSTKTFSFDPNDYQDIDTYDFVAWRFYPGFYKILSKSCDWLPRALEPQYPWAQPNNAIRMQKPVVPTLP